MKRIILSICIICLIALLFIGIFKTKNTNNENIIEENMEEPKEENKIKAIYLGVKNSEIIPKEDILNEDKCIYQFKINDEVKDYCIKNKDNDLNIQNHLIENEEFLIEINEDKIVSAKIIDDSKIKGIVKGYEPGKRTIKNFLLTSISPLGHTMYVYGGGWNIEDNGSSFTTRTIGTLPIWDTFYNSTDENYSYKKDTYPINGWNRYYYKGLDCSGYVGWTLYNTMYTEKEKEEGFVTKSTGMAKVLSEKYNYGTWNHPTNKDYKIISEMLHPGDIISMYGHVYIVLGTCNDGSIVIIHSTVTESITKVEGGGVQISAISLNGNTSCEACTLSKEYMEKYYSEWTKKYPIAVRNASFYLSFNDELTGIFSWYPNEKGLEDPENIRNMNAKEVLKMLFDN